MSIELDWSALDADLTSSVISFFTSAFTSASRPNFLGEISVTNFSFGDKEPTVEVLDVRDIYKEFLEVDEEDEEEMRVMNDNNGSRRNNNNNNYQERERDRERDGGSGSYQDSSRRDFLGDIYSSNLAQQQQHQQQQHQQQNSNSNSNQQSNSFQDFNSSTLPTPLFRSIINNTRPSSASLFSPGLNNTFLPPTQNHSNTPSQSHLSADYNQNHSNPPLYQQNPSNHSSPTSSSSIPKLSPSYSSSPSLQIHLKVTYTGNLHIGLSTSLLINYPSPNFMSLPLQLSVTSLAFEGIVLIAFEGDRRRIHMSILDPKDELGEVGGNGNETTAGGRLLKGAVVESEVGQKEKHVLKNVGKVEKFVLDVARSTLESEMVFPNFQTILF